MSSLNFGSLADFQERISQLLELKDWKGLERIAKQMIQRAPQDYRGFKWLARASRMLKKSQQALYAYQRWHDFDPKSKEATDFFTEFPSLAKESMAREESIPKQRVQNSTQFYLKPEQRAELSKQEEELGRSYYNTKLFAEASEAFLRSFNWQARETVALYYAESLRAAQNHNKAQYFLRQRISSKPAWIAGRLLLAKVLHDQGANNVAQKEWQNVLRLDPNNAEALAAIKKILIA